MNYPKLIKFCRLTLSLISLIVALPLTAQTSSKNIPCCGVSEAQHAFPHHREELRNLQSSDTRAIPNDNILRLYRLAIPIDYHFFRDKFKGDINAAKRHWDMLEEHLNRIYQRDLGIAFTLVRDDKLIRTTEDKAVFRWKSSEYIVNNGTSELNKIINSDSYDIAIWLADFGDNRGLASFKGGFSPLHKGNAATAFDHLGTTAHEIAHLFGASHTGTTGTLPPSRHAEPEEGTSLMSYGFHQTKAEDLFFSLVTIEQVRKNLEGCGYYTDTARSNLIPSKPNNSDYTNYPVGFQQTNNRQPAFSFDQAKKTYRVTKGTALRFNFPTYSDATDYLYCIHQNDISESIYTSKAKLVALPWKSGPSIHLMLPEYEIFWNGYTEQHIEQKTGLPVGNYKILMGAVENLGNNNAKEYKRSLDAVEAQLEVVEGIPFRITSGLRGQKLKAGEDVTLTWNIDKSIYSEQEKVRIWLSDDYGKTYKYLVVDEAPNTGRHTFKVPEISVGAVSGVSNKMQGKGIFLIEVKGHIACATTDYRPSATDAQGGGFTIESSRNTLQPYVHTYLERGSNPTQPQPEVPKNYKVTLVQGEGGTISISNTNLDAVAKGTRLEVNVQTQDGYRLTSLKANEEDITASKAFVVNADTRVVAVFAPIETPKPKTYSLTLRYNPSEGELSIDQEKPEAIPEGTTVRVNAKAKEGYQLSSLKAGDKDILSTRSFVINANTEVVAIFTLTRPTPPATPNNPDTGEDNTDEEEGSKEEIKVYPTLFTSTLYISGYEHIKRVVLYDLMGRKVQDWSIAPAQLNLGDLMPNIYLVVLYPKDGGKSISFKVQKR